MRVDDAQAEDVFSYRVQLQGRSSSLVSIPSGWVLKGFNHGGFGVMDTGGNGQGYSWFIFIGPRSLRDKTPFADWNKVVEDYKKSHSGNARVEAPPYPTLGRMNAEGY